MATAQGSYVDDNTQGNISRGVGADGDTSLQLSSLDVYLVECPTISSLNLYDVDLISIQLLYCVMISWKNIPYTPKQKKPVLYSVWMSSAHNQCKISRFTSLSSHISESRTIKIFAIEYWVQSQQGRTFEAPSSICILTPLHEAMVIRGDASVTVNGEVPSCGCTNMLANHHMKEAERFGGWDLGS